MTVRYTSYNRAWCDKVEAALKAQGARTSRSTETTYQITDMDGALLARTRGAAPEYELGKVRKPTILYIVTSDKELDS